MRIAVVADIHGNRTALEAVIEDLRGAAPDLVLQGGDVADQGSSPAEVVDRIQELGWPGVGGNTDEMLWRPESLLEFLDTRPHLRSVFAELQVEDLAALTRERLGARRLAWLRELPPQEQAGPVALVHASPGNRWQAPAADASETELEAVYAGLGSPLVVYGHLHFASIRRAGGLIVANAGSAGLPYDGDPRAAYLLVTDGKPEIRRVEYDVEREVTALKVWGSRHAERIGSILRSGRPH